MPFGLKGAAANFQRLMSNVLYGMQGLSCLVCSDDIILFGETLQVRNVKPRDVFARLRRHNLKLQPDKREFLMKKVTCLGHRLTFKRLIPDFDHVKAMELPTPTNTRQPKEFWV